MRKISANHILPVSSPALKNGIITLDDKGMILEIYDTGGKLREEPGLEFYMGTIVPGFILPWLRMEDTAQSLQELDRELYGKGIKGVGLVLRENMLSDLGFKLMRDSPNIYHPVIEICPESDEDEFEAFNRGIDLASRAWNDFNLSCSLTACSSVEDNSDTGKYLAEYALSHRNAIRPEETSSPEGPLNILKNIQLSHPKKSLAELLPLFTLEAAAGIFEDDVLGSIEKGKTPGLNLISGLDPETLGPAEKTVLKVLV